MFKQRKRERDMKRFIVVVFLLLYVLVGCRENTVDKIKK